MSALALSGCASKAIKWEQGEKLDEGVWSSYILVKEKKSGKVHSAKADIYADKQDSIFRLDATYSALNIFVGSLLSDPETTKFLLAREKKFYVGETGPQMMKALIKFPLDPRLLVRLLFDQELDPGQWECRSSGIKDAERACRNKEKTLAIFWKSIRPEKRILDLRSAQVDMTLHLELNQTAVAEKEKVFTLEAPEGFKVFQVK